MPGTVTVACALPHGFIMQLQAKEEIPAPTREDPQRKDEIWTPTGKSVRINGPARNRDPQRLMSGNAILTAGGYALTPNVDKDHWEKWREQMKDWPPLAQGHVFAHERHDAAQGQARENRAGPSGFEPYNPSKPPAEFAGKVKTADKQGG